ncbi:Uncharacterised protein [Bordetella pertussis]|nr:Uncharacterised protein [Bordetella pertussis]CPK66531.1 Uncharacterised protein [Bordetella pertussis]
MPDRRERNTSATPSSPRHRPASLRQPSRSPSTGPARMPINKGLVLISTAMKADDTVVKPVQLNPR